MKNRIVFVLTILVNMFFSGFLNAQESQENKHASETDIYLQGLHLTQSGDTDQAIKLFNSIDGESADVVKQQAGLALANFYKKDYVNAHKYIGQLIQYITNESQKSELIRIQGICQLLLRKPFQALIHFQQANKITPSSETDCLISSAYLMGISDTEKGIAPSGISKQQLLTQCYIHLNEAIEKENSDPRLYLSRGTFFININRLDEAKDDFEQAFKLSPEGDLKELSRIMLAQTWRQDALNSWSDGPDMRDCIQKIDKSIEIFPGDWTAYFYRASFLLSFYQIKGKDQGIQGQIVSDCTMSISMEPRQFECYAVRAKIYMNQYRIEKAAADIENAVKYFPNAPDYVWRIYAEILMHQNKFKEAVDVYSKLISIQNQTVSPELYSSRAYAYRKLGNYDLAETDIKKAEALFDQYEQITVSQNEIQKMITSSQFLKNKSDISIDYTPVFSCLTGILKK